MGTDNSVSVPASAGQRGFWQLQMAVTDFQNGQDPTIRYWIGRDGYNAVVVGWRPKVAVGQHITCLFSWVVADGELTFTRVAIPSDFSRASDFNTSWELKKAGA